MNDVIEEAPFVDVAPLAEGEVGRLVLTVRREGPVKRLFVLSRPSRPEVSDAFVARARIARGARHRNLLEARDVEEDRAGPFLAHAWVEGLAVQDICGALGSAGEPIPLQIAVRIALQLAEALEPLAPLPGAIAPRFVLVGWDEIVRVTSASIGAGDLGYCAPEVLRGAHPDARSDLFALGVCLYELLTGARLYPREDSRSSRRVLEEPTPDVALEREDVPVPVVELLFELMAKSPVQRPASAAIVARRLSDALRDLVEEEDALTLGAWLEERFGRERDVRRRRIADAVVPLERSGL